MTHHTAGHVLAEIAVEPVVEGSGHGGLVHKAVEALDGSELTKGSALFLRRWKGRSMTFSTPSPGLTRRLRRQPVVSSQRFALRASIKAWA